MKFKIWLLLALWLPVQALCYNYESITVDLGLANMIVRSTTQDANHLLWLATNSGVQSFDGTSFRDYHIRDMSGANSSDNRFTQVLTDGDGVLYAVTHTRVFRYNSDLDRFEAVFPMADADTDNLSIHRVDVLPGNKVCISTPKGLYWLDATCKPRSTAVKTECFGVVQRSGSIFVASSRGLLRLGELAGENVTLDDKLPGEPINFLFADSRENCWVQQRGCVSILQSSGQTIVPAWNRLLLNKPVRSIVEYEGQYVVAVDGLGLLFCDPDFSLASIDRPVEGDDSSLTIDGIYHLFRDADNYLWISTFMGGLNYINPNALGFRHIRHRDNHPNSLSNNSVRAVMEHSDGTLWFGSKNGVSVLDPRSDRWTHKMNLPSNTVLALCEDMNHNVWVSAFSAGIIVCDRNLRPVRYLNSDNSDLSSNDIFVIFRDSDSDMWLSGEDGVITQIRMPSMEIVRYPVNNIAREIRQLRSGEIVITGSSGVHAIDKRTRTLRQIYPRVGSASHMSMLYSLVEDPSGDLWLASEGDGLIRITLQGEIVDTLTVDDGLLSNVAYGLERIDNDLWISTNRGLSRYGLMSRAVVNFTKDSGIGMSGFIYCCHTTLRSGEVMFGGLGGAVLFAPRDIHYKRSARPLIFTALRLFDREIVPGENAPIDRAIDRCREVRLRHNQNSLSISFASVTPINGIYNEYEWMLSGVDETWSKPTSNHTASYNNLRPGHYRFTVRSVNSGHSMPPVERYLDINVLPPWWQTLWAYGAYLIVFACIAILGSVYVRGMILVRVNANKVRLFTGIAHDIKTPLSIIRLLLSNIRGRVSDDASEQDIALAVKQADLLAELANQLLDVEKVTSGNALPPKVGKYRVEASIEGISCAFSSLIEHKQIRLTFDFPQTPTWAWFDMNMFQKVIYNLLDNAVKYTPEGGQITITTRIEPKWCHIAVSDTGIGIPDYEKGNILRNYFRAANAVDSSAAGWGIGLMLVRALVKQMSGRIWFESTENVGTTFHLLLPLGRIHIRQTDQITDSITKPAQSPVGRYRVLIVEDNTELRDVIAQKLETIYQVDVAADGEEALDRMADNIPDLVITDYMMPRMNGIELSRRIKAHPDYSHIPIIMLTALSSNEHKVEGFNVGVDSYIEKPFDINVILARIENLISNRALLAKNESGGLNEQPENDQAEAKIIKVFESYVIEHLSDCDFTVEDICRQMGVGYTSFYRKIKTTTGKTPIDLITEIRLRKAREYLDSGNFTVSQVGYMTGFSSPSYFTKVYKKHFGVTPGKKG